MERFGRDVLAILDDLNVDKVHWCGLQWAAWSGDDSGPMRRSGSTGSSLPTDRLLLFRAFQLALYHIKIVKEGGIAAIADAVIANWLTAPFRNREDRRSPPI